MKNIESEMGAILWLRIHKSPGNKMGISHPPKTKQTLKRHITKLILKT
jgi:hypothetical protein